MGKLRNVLPPKPAELRPADSGGRLSPHSDSSERKLIQQFESGLIPEASFHHADHVHLAFAYLSQYPLLRALDKFSAALKRYATSRGKSRLYHETITYAFCFLIRERMARCAACSGVNDWDEFCRRNPDLLVWKNGILTRYYEESTLQSDLARTVFLFPDKLR
jgi:hypothetical protein